MILRIPDFYDSFHCIDSDCPDNCCIGWELDIDDDTYEYYRSVKGPFGDRLRANISDAKETSESGINSFHLRVNGRCPFLNEDNLCDICLKLGPDALCRICTDYPRYSFEWGDVIEKSLTLSCPEAGRLLFLNDIPVSFKEIPLNETGLDAYMTEEEYGEMGKTDLSSDDSDDTRCHSKEQSISDPTKEYRNDDISVADDISVKNSLIEDNDFYEEDPEQIQKISLARTECIKILQDRTLPLSERVSRYLAFCETPDFSLSLRSRLDILSGMEILNERWTAIMEALENRFAADAERYRKALKAYLDSDDYRTYEYTYEHLLVYYTFRYFPRAAYDYNPAEKARFAVFCCEVVRDLDALRYEERGKFTFEDRIETVKDFSKQVEHSDYNIDYLMEELLFANMQPKERTL